MTTPASETTIQSDTDTNLLITALIKAQGEFPPVLKTAINPFFKSKYTPLDELNDTIDPILRKYGLAVLQPPDIVDGKQALRTVLVHQSGQLIQGVRILSPTKSDEQSMNSAITYARRYDKASILGIATEDDDDGNTASGKSNGKKSKTPKHKPPTQPPPNPEPDIPMDPKADPAPPANGKGFDKKKATALYFVRIKDLFKNDEDKHSWQHRITATGTEEGEASVSDWEERHFQRAWNAVAHRRKQYEKHLKNRQST